MNRGRFALAACAALSAIVSCKSEATLYLLGSGAASTATTDAGIGGELEVSGVNVEAAAGEVEASTEDGDSASEPSDAPRVAPTPCQEIDPEVCEGGGDACSDEIDAACGDHVLWTEQPASNVFLGNPTGGVSFLEPCPQGAVLTGMRIGMGNWLNQVAAICKTIVLNVDATMTPPRVWATLGPRLDAPLAPAASTDSKNQLQDLQCAAGSILSAVNGTTTTGAGYHYVLGINLRCAPLVVTVASSASILETDRTQEQEVGPIVCVSCSAAQAFNFTTAIDAGRVAAGIFGSDGLWVDRVAFSESLAVIAGP